MKNIKKITAIFIFALCAAGLHAEPVNFVTYYPIPDAQHADITTAGPSVLMHQGGEMKANTITTESLGAEYNAQGYTVLGKGSPYNIVYIGKKSVPEASPLTIDNSMGNAAHPLIETEYANIGRLNIYGSDFPAPEAAMTWSEFTLKGTTQKLTFLQSGNTGETPTCTPKKPPVFKQITKAVFDSLQDTCDGNSNAAFLGNLIPREGCVDLARCKGEEWEGGHPDGLGSATQKCNGVYEWYGFTIGTGSSHMPTKEEAHTNSAVLHTSTQCPGPVIKYNLDLDRPRTISAFHNMYTNATVGPQLHNKPGSAPCDGYGYHYAPTFNAPSKGNQFEGYYTHPTEPVIPGCSSSSDYKLNCKLLAQNASGGYNLNDKKYCFIDKDPNMKAPWEWGASGWEFWARGADDRCGSSQTYRVACYSPSKFAPATQCIYTNNQYWMRELECK